MLAPQRQDVILERIRVQGSVRVRELSTLLEVSDMTVRRDLDLLAQRGLLEKVHGGAIRSDGLSSTEPGFAAKQHKQQVEKDAIATTAAAMVGSGLAVGLTAGTTTWTMAKLLLDVPGLTVVTNAPSIAQVFYQADTTATVVLTGGVRTPSDALVGPIASQTLQTLHLDLLFMGVHGMDAGLGYSTPNLAEADVNRHFLSASRRTVVMADHTKWGTRGLAQIAPLEAADVVISDEALGEAARNHFARAGVELELATAAQQQVA